MAGFRLTHNSAQSIASRIDAGTLRGERLLPELRDLSHSVRRAPYQAVQEVGYELVQIFRASLLDPNGDVRALTAQTIVEAGRNGVDVSSLSDQLIKLTNDPEPELHVSALVALGYTDGNALPTLSQHIKIDGDEASLTASLGALAELSKRGVQCSSLYHTVDQLLIHQSNTVQTSAVYALASFPPDNLPPHTDAKIYSLVPTFGRRNDPRLSKLTSAAIGAIGQWASRGYNLPPRVRNRVISHLNNPDPVVRSTAATTVGHFPPESVTPEARGVLRSMASSGVHMHQGARYTDVRDRWSQMRWSATKALGRVGNEEDVQTISTLLSHDDPHTAWLAAEALATIHSRGFEMTHYAGAIGRLHGRVDRQWRGALPGQRNYLRRHLENAYTTITGQHLVDRQ